jgi:hypothetical protein
MEKRGKGRGGWSCRMEDGIAFAMIRDEEVLLVTCRHGAQGADHQAEGEG